MGKTNTKCSRGPIRPGRSGHTDGLRAGWGPLGSCGAVSPFSPSKRRVTLLMAITAAVVPCPAQTQTGNPDGKPVLADPSGSESGLDYYAQGGVVVDGIAYFLADQSCSKYWKADGYPFGVAFDVRTFTKTRTYAFQDTYDSCPLVIRAQSGTWLVLAHEHKQKRTVAMNRDTGEVVWTSPANQPGSYFFGYSYYVRPGGSRLVFVASQNGLHALSSEDGTEVWHVPTKSTGGVTPCVDQEQGWVFYQADGQLMKVRATDGAVLKSAPVPRPCTTVSWNTVLVDDAHGYFVATYWFDFYAEDGKTRKMEWNSAIRVHDADLNLVWKRTGLPGSKKSTLTYVDGKVIIGAGGHWGAKYEGDAWKRVTAYSVKTGDVGWECDLSAYDYNVIVNAPYAYGSVYAEAWGKTGKMFRINARTGALEEVLDYGVGIGSCAPSLAAHGMVLSGDLVRDGIIVTQVAEDSTADWPGPFCNPQTNTYALPDDPAATPVPMRELRVANGR